MRQEKAWHRSRNVAQALREISEVKRTFGMTQTLLLLKSIHRPGGKALVRANRRAAGEQRTLGAHRTVRLYLLLNMWPSRRAAEYSSVPSADGVNGVSNQEGPFPPDFGPERLAPF